VSRSTLVAAVVFAVGLLLAVGGAQAAIGAVPAASRFVAPDGSDEGTCTRSDPCLSLDRAYHLAKPGQIVEVRGGTYGDQSVTLDAAKTSGPAVLFRPAAGQTVVLTGHLWIYAQNVTFDGTAGRFQFTGWFARNGADRVTFRNTHTGLFLCGGATNLTVVGGEVGPWTSTEEAEDTQITTDDGVPCSNVVIRNVFFHDMHASGGSHTDCLQITTGTNITIDGNRFIHCWSDAIIAKADFGNIVNLIIQNNEILDPVNDDHSTPVAVSVLDNANGAPDGVTTCSSLIRNNSFAARLNDQFKVACRPSGKGNRVYGNIFAQGARSGCQQNGAVWDYNVWEEGPTCGRHAVLLRPLDAFYVNRSSNLCLRRKSGAIERGNPQSFPSKDIGGRKRPRGKRPDAGACEFPLKVRHR
jgi:hypothetical protein